MNPFEGLPKLIVVYNSKPLAGRTPLDAPYFPVSWSKHWDPPQRFLVKSLAEVLVRAQEFRFRDFRDRVGQYMQRRPHCLCVDQLAICAFMHLTLPMSLPSDWGQP